MSASSAVYYRLVRCGLCGLKWWRGRNQQHCPSCFPEPVDGAS